MSILHLMRDPGIFSQMKTEEDIRLNFATEDLHENEKRALSQ
jgi:hypothetical protein